MLPQATLRRFRPYDGAGRQATGRIMRPGAPDNAACLEMYLNSRRYGTLTSQGMRTNLLGPGFPGLLSVHQAAAVRTDCQNAFPSPADWRVLHFAPLRALHFAPPRHTGLSHSFTLVTFGTVKGIRLTKVDKYSSNS